MGPKDRGFPPMNTNADPQLLADAQAMVLRDRNHPSVVIWSLCNEGGCQIGATTLKYEKNKIYTTNLRSIVPTSISQANHKDLTRISQGSHKQTTISK